MASFCIGSKESLSTALKLETNLNVCLLTDKLLST